MNHASVPSTPPIYNQGSSFDDEIDLGELLGAIRGGRWILMGAMLGGLALGALYAWSAVRSYEADALVQVEKEKSAASAALGDLAEVIGTPSASSTAEIELLKSRLLVGAVVDGLQLTIVAHPDYFPIIGRAVARGFVPGPPGSAVSAPVLGLRRFAWGGEFVKVSSFDVPSALYAEEFSLVALGEGAYELLYDGGRILAGQVGTRAETAPSEAGDRIGLFVQDLVAAPGTRFRLTRITRTEAIEGIQKSLKVSEKGKDTGILQVSFSSDDAAFSREVINRLVIAYQRQNVERKSAEAAQTLAFLERQLPELRAKLEAAERTFNNYRLKEGSADLTKETELILQQSVQLETARVELEQQKQAALQRFTPNHPSMVAIDRQMAAVRAEQDAITGRVKDLPETQQELLRLSREVEVNTALYTGLLNNYQELLVIKAGTIGNVRIVDYAVDARKPAKPKVPLVLALSLILGLLLGVVAIFVRRALKQAVHDPAEVERTLGIPTYATIPYTPVQARMFRGGRKSTGQLLAFSDPQNVAVEAIRSLRTSLHFAMLDAPNNVLMLTGPAPELGKSFVSINLGAVLSMSGKRVVVVDGDMRRGHLNEFVGCERAPGVSDYCAGQADIEGVVRRTAVDGLFVVPTGQIPPNPAELLLGDRFSELVSALSLNFDYVVIDTPPILAVTDAAIVGKLAGCTLLVLKAGEHPMAMIQDTAARLQNAGVRVRGTIFNQVGRSGTGYAASYGYRGYTSEYKSISA